MLCGLPENKASEYRPCRMKRFQSMLGVLLLLAYACTATSVMPAVFAALAVIDGSHRVMICRTEQGTEVRLHHRENDFTPEVCDHVGMLARLVVSFCRPAEEGDHSLATSQVTGTLTSQDDEAKRSAKDKLTECNTLSVPPFSHRLALLPQAQACRPVGEDFHDSSGATLREIATVRLLI